MRDDWVNGYWVSGVGLGLEDCMNGERLERSYCRTQEGLGMSLISDERAEELLANEKEKDAEIERLKALLIRAADALEIAISQYGSEYEQGLIVELLEAATA